DVLPEWQRTLAILGGEEDVERFMRRAAEQLGAPLEPVNKSTGTFWKLHIGSLPAAVRERLEAEGLTGSLSIDFHQPASPRAAFVHRTHPIVAILADHLLEVALDEAPQDTALLDAVARSGAIFTDAVEVRTTVLL